MASGSFKFKKSSIKMALMFFCLSVMIAPTGAFLRHLCFNPLGLARIDPIVTPDKPSQHVHHLHGSSNLGIGSTDADYLLEGNCTSCSVTVDRSGYWAPAMYFQHENNTFELLTTASAITIYYKLEKRVNFENQNYTIFPKGFRMIAGNSLKRTWNGPWPVPDQSNWGPADTTQGALAEKSLGFNCLNYQAPAEASFEYPYLRDKAFIDAHCADGIRAEVLFPSCWDGQNLDSPDHKTHVAYPNLIQDGACPETHSVYLPILFYETIWNTQQFVGVPGQFVFANGDPTGFGYHGDFIAAWNDGVLQQIYDDPSCTDHDLNHRKSTGIQEECDAIASSIQSQEVAAMCKLEVPEILRDEKISGLLPILPGGVQVLGVRHDPGTYLDDLSSANATSPVVVTVTPEPSISSSTPIPTQMVTPVATTAPVSAPSPAVVYTTSTYTSDGTYIELVIAEEVVTTTVVANPDGSLVARHGHGAGHGKHM